MSENTQETLTVQEMQKLLKIGTNTAYKLIHSNAFPVCRIGHSFRIPKDSFYAWMRTSFAAEL